MISNENTEKLSELYFDLVQNKNPDAKVFISLILVLAFFDEINIELFINSYESRKKEKNLQALNKVELESLKAFTKELFV